VIFVIAAPAHAVIRYECATTTRTDDASSEWRAGVARAIDYGRAGCAEPPLLDEQPAHSISLDDAETRNAPAVLRGTPSADCRLRRRARRDGGIVLSL